MQFRPDVGNGPGLTLRRPGPGPPFAAPPLRAGFPVDYGPRVDDRRYAVQVLSRQQQQQSHHQLHPKSSQGGDDSDEALPSRHLWVGNVSQEVTEGLLIEKFSKFGAIESVTVYSQRNYAFINFRDVDNAQDAKNGLQGVVLGGLSMRIEFAKGAKPSRHLWVGGISQAVSREQIEGEFRRFGMLEDFKFLRDRSCAFVDYEKIEDAIAAVDSLNGKIIGDEELRVDFGRSQPPKREPPGRPGTATSHEDWGGPPGRDDRDRSETYWVPPDGSRQSDKGLSGDTFSGPYDALQASLGPGSAVPASVRGRAEKEEPSDVLWVGFPLLSKVDEEGLHRAFVPYGEVERVKTFPGRTYAFVQFKNVEEASRAKLALEGKLFNDPRVHIRFSNSEIGPVENTRMDGNLPSPSRGREGHGFSEKFNARIPTSDRFGSLIPPLRQTGLRPEYYPGGLARGTALSRTVGTGPTISLGHRLGRGSGSGGPDGKLPFAGRDAQTGSQGGKGLPGLGAARPSGGRPYDEQWDSQDEDVSGRESKKPRMFHGGGVDSSSYEGGRRSTELDNLGNDSDREGCGLPLLHNTGSGDDYLQGGALARARLGSVQFDRHRHTAASQAKTHPGTFSGLGLTGGFRGGANREGFGADGGGTAINEGWRWHGTIAKGGTPVCRARCLPIGKGIDVTVPDVVNCTARTDLDMLAKHVYEAGDFGVVFFIPEADPDIPPYHDFMHYLGEKHRAGVARLADGTTLFLVPPSDFSEKVLKVPGNNCLFGVVLETQQPISIGPAQIQQQLPPAQQHHIPQQLPQLTQHQSVVHQQHPKSQGLASVNGQPAQDGGGLPGTSPSRGQPPVPTSAISTMAQSQLTGMVAGLPTVLTPELIASLSSLLPQQKQAIAGQSMSGSNMFPPPGREGMGVGLMSRLMPNLGSISIMDNRSTYRPNSQQSALQSQALPSVQPDLQSGNEHVFVPPEQSFVFAPPPQQLQAAELPQVPLSGGLPGQGQQAQSHGFSRPGYGGQQLLQQPRPFQNSPPELGDVPLLPSDQLAQLTALLTQRQQQPQQQQQAAQLLQQHYQQQSPLQISFQQNQLPGHPLQPQVQGYNQQTQPQPQQYAPQSSSQQQWAQGAPLSQHSLQLAQHAQVLKGGHNGGWDGTTMGQGQQYLQQQPPSATLQLSQLPQQQSLQPLSTVGVTGEQAGGLNQDDAERQKRFQATLQLAAALLQQMQHP